MIKLGLRHAELRALHRLLAEQHSVHVRLQVLSLDHDYVGDISKRLLGGQVNIDADADITRTLELDLFDPYNNLHLDSDSPDDGALYLDRMIRVIYVVTSPYKGDSYDIPIFCGPIRKLDRNQNVIHLEAHGKESLSLANMWRGHTYKKGLRKTTVIRRILDDLMGENRRYIPDRKARTPRNVDLGRESSPWKVARRVAASMGCQLFYDGRGQARLRRWPTKSIFTFDGAHLLTDPVAGYDLDGVVNAVSVRGAKPKGAKKHIKVRVVAKRSHPLSPWRLGRGDVPLYLPEFIEDDEIRTKKDAREVAKRHLRRGLIQSVDVTFDSLPIPHLEPDDVCRVHTEQFSARFRLAQASIPLTADGKMSVGYLRRVTPNRRAIRGRRRKHKHRARG